MRYLFVVGVLFVTVIVFPTAGSADLFGDCEQTKDEDLAFRACTQIIDRGEKETRHHRMVAHYRRGLIYLKKGQYDRAITEHSQEISLSPRRNSFAYHNRGNAYFFKGQYDLAIADYSQAIKMARNYPDFYNKRAWSYFKMGKAAKGLPDAKYAVRLNPRHHQAWYTLGAIHQTLGDKAKAIDAYRKAMALDPKHELGRDKLIALGVEP